MLTRIYCKGYRDQNLSQRSQRVPFGNTKAVAERYRQRRLYLQKAGLRYFLNELLLDILSRKEFKNALRIYPEFEFSVSELSDTAEKVQHHRAQ